MEMPQQGGQSNISPLSHIIPKGKDCFYIWSSRCHTQHYHNNKVLAVLDVVHLARAIQELSIPPLALELSWLLHHTSFPFSSFHLLATQLVVSFSFHFPSTDPFWLTVVSSTILRKSEPADLHLYLELVDVHLLSDLALPRFLQHHFLLSLSSQQTQPSLVQLG